MSNIVRYIRARETYDPKSLKDDFNLAQIHSTGTASSDLVNLYTANNKDNPVGKYGTRGSVSVNIKAISFPNNRTALVRFSTLEQTSTRNTERAWQALVRFRYTSSPITNELRFENPLGFQVTEYRRDQETVRATTNTIAAPEIVEPATPLVDPALVDTSAKTDGPVVPGPFLRHWPEMEVTSSPIRLRHLCHQVEGNHDTCTPRHCRDPDVRDRS